MNNIYGKTMYYINKIHKFELKDNKKYFSKKNWHSFSTLMA